VALGSILMVCLLPSPPNMNMNIRMTHITRTTQQQLSHPPSWRSSVKHHGDTKTNTDTDTNTDANTPTTETVRIRWDPPLVEKRCDWVMEQFAERDAGISDEELRTRYQTQSVDANVFYRATASLFWKDFVNGHWDDGLLMLSSVRREDGIHVHVHAEAHLKGGVPLDHKSTWTWVTGDQHLSNFGAWRNRHGDVVFGVNDFDEAAIYDFQIDVLRIAVSVWNHAISNGLSDQQVLEALEEFTDTYVTTAIDYVGNEDASLFELTSKTAKGTLKKFLKDVEGGKSSKKQIKKYTTVDKHGVRRFQKGNTTETPDKDTKLAALSPGREAELRQVFTSTKYGATMMKLGWAVRAWDDEFFTVLDVAARIGSGVGSFGADRYYVLLKGTDGLLREDKDEEDGSAVVLDVKYQPPGAVTQILTPSESAWYDIMFPNAAARTTEAQRRLTSYTDPYTGLVMLADDEGTLQPFSVRQRSPWKESLDLDELTKPKHFYKFMSQIAAATATSHVRGSVGKAPGDFKHVIKALLGEKEKRTAWGDAIARLASAYHEQVLLDFECFHNSVKTNYG
jgi:uncharacterized protein (DUF2252 family)